MAEITAYKYQDLLKTLGIEITDLGCVMLDVDPLDTSTIIPQEWRYRTDNPKLRWINDETGTHVTLKYGFLQNAHLIRNAIEEVLIGWWPENVSIKDIGYFPSSIPGEEYSCIIGHIEVAGSLAEAHARLSVLPHIDTHEKYRPHITLAYVKNQYRDRAINLLEGAYLNQNLPTGAINYGYPPK